VEVLYRLVPETQFQGKKTQVAFSSRSLSDSQPNKSEVRLIKNKNNVVVGQLLGNGMEFSPMVPIVSGVMACIEVTFDPKNHYDVSIHYLDLATTYDNYSSFTPLGLDYPLNTTLLCTSFTEVEVFFPIGLTKNWRTERVIDTWSDGELFFLFFGFCLYVILLIFDLFNFVHIIETPSVICTAKFWTLPMVALSLIALFLIDRIIYFILVPYGLSSAEVLDSIFSELPALIFFSIYSLVVIRWMEIYHFTMKSARSGEGGISKLLPVVLGVNVFMCLLFIVLLVVFLTVPSGEIAINCTTNYQFKPHTTAAEVVSNVYNLFFAIVCIALAILYGLYGYRILSLMSEGGAAETPAMRQKYLRLTVNTCVCTIALLVQAALLIHATFSSSSRSIYAVVPIILFAEVIPTLIFLFMFSKTSSFIKHLHKTTAAGLRKHVNHVKHVLPSRSTKKNRDVFIQLDEIEDPDGDKNGDENDGDNEGIGATWWHK